MIDREGSLYGLLDNREDNFTDLNENNNAGFMTSGSPGWDAWTPRDRDALHFDADSETACITLNSYPDTQESIRAAMAADTSLSTAEKETVEHLYFSGLSF